MNEILVVGSLNIDLVSYVSHFPRSGETIKSDSFSINTGGKGANQAVMSSRLGARVSMVGSVGDDSYGEKLLNELKKEKINTDHIKTEGQTGLAFITVNNKGENKIILVPGANDNLNESDINNINEKINSVDLIIMQLEIPLKVIEQVLVLAKEKSKKVILNPAPAKKLPLDILKNVDTLIPNESELHLLTNMPVNTFDEIKLASKHLIDLGVKQVITTMGENGSYYTNGLNEIFLEAKKVEVVDTTGAGDSYVAAFSVGIVEGMDYMEAMKFANSIASVVVTNKGAIKSLPHVNKVNSIKNKIIREK